MHAWQLNSERLFGEFLASHKEKILDLIDKGSIFSKEDIAPLINTALPGMAEMAALLGIRDALGSQKYSRIVIDTAPFGHTLRLFALPDQFVRFLEFLQLAASRDQVLANHFGGQHTSPTADIVTEFKTMVSDIQNATSREAELILVTTGESFSLNESLRCATALAGQTPPIRISSVILNRAAPEGTKCRRCANAHGSRRLGLQFLSRYFPGTRVQVGEDPGGPIMGCSALLDFGEHIFSGKRLRYKLRPPASGPLNFEKVTWPVLDSSLSLVLGKGGVGKTTISAALGFNTRKRTRKSVEICSVDPAPSLDDVFETKVGAVSKPVLKDMKFLASELDAVTLFHQWIAELQSNVDDTTTSEISGIHLDLSFERRLLSLLLEIVPPGVDEVLAIFRILDLMADKGTHVVIDMAPTGHALELLRMPDRILSWTRPLLKTLALHRTLAFARDAGVKIAELNHRVRELSALLADPKEAAINIVMLPEILPDRETERLLKAIAALRSQVRRVFINRALLERRSHCSRCSTARQWQEATLSKIKRKLPKSEIVVVKNFPYEIAGRAALQSLTGELWRLA